MLGRFPMGNSVSVSVKESVAVLFQLLDEELDVIDHADNPHLFFLAYRDAVKYCGKILSYKPGKRTDSHILEILHHLFGDKTEITNRFLDRLSTGGRLSYDIDAIIENRDEMTEASYDYFLSLTGLDELCYTYCTVTFGGNRTYDYICEIPDISIGDEVIVPVGEEETEKLAKVAAIKEYRYDEVAYPVSKTKRIIAKYGCGL
jgi:hypothetical protein